MQITIELPDNIANQLQPGNISHRVLELIAADYYRQGRIGAAEVRRMLNFSSRLEKPTNSSNVKKPTYPTRRMI